jgi:ribonucleoside-diphosphate reductase alpha chain
MKKGNKIEVKTDGDNCNNEDLVILSEIASEIVEKNPKTPDLSKLTVVKRGGSIVPFHADRIEKAIEAAFRDVKKIERDAPLPDALATIVKRLTFIVVERAFELGKKGVALSVEGLQDIVEVSLMKNGYHDIAKGYILYREERAEAREHAPSNIRIYRNDGTTKVRFNPMKITSTIENTFRRVHELGDLPTPVEIIQSVNELSQKVIDRVVEINALGTTLNLQMIQNCIEEILMKDGYFLEAKNYILFRSERENSEKAATHQSAILPKSSKDKKERSFSVLSEDGSTKMVHEPLIRQKISFACRGYEGAVSIEDLFESTCMNFYEGMKEDEVDAALIMAARAKVEIDPAYSIVTSRFLLDKLYRETLEISSLDPQLDSTCKSYFPKYIKIGVSFDRLSPDLLNYDLEKLASALVLERDDLFQYLGLQTLYDRYFIHNEGKRLESPQIFWMRVAMGLALKEEKKEERAIEFYNILSQLLYTPGTPTLFNSGTKHSQLSSCYLSTVEDDLVHIFKVISDDAQLSKWAGGLGNDWTSVRATGSLIKGTNGKSQGVIPFLKVANDTAVAVNQGGKRQGALCSYLETWHLDIEDFLELRKNTGDERRRTHDMNTANWIPDLFMKRVLENGEWTLFTPSETPDLHDLYGSAFEKRYVEYEKMADRGEIKVFKKLDATTLWRKMLSMLFETGHPWITFKDPSNIRSPQDHKGVVHCSNLCTEILLNTSKEEIAVCNIGSVNLLRHFKDGKIDKEMIKNTVRTAIRMLDNVIDINFYPVKEAEFANKSHRAIGLGIMGLQDILYLMKVSFASHEAVALSDQIMELVSYYAILSSSELAKERGTYSSYTGSKWDRGLLPIDTIDLLEKERGVPVSMDRSMQMDWEPVRAHIKKYGMRNCNTMAIAPTATIANIVGVFPSIEPPYKNLYVKSNLSGEFTILNSYLIEELKAHGLWDEEMLDDLKYYDGSLNEIERIPSEIKERYVTAFEIDPEWVLEGGSRRQKWIDMGQSLNLFLAEPSGKKLHEMYVRAWNLGLKTTYYLRSLGATQIEKSTTDINKRGLQPRWMKNASASSNIKVEREPAKPKACSLQNPDCESCQ